MQKEVFILDSNIWISYVITKQLQTLVTLIQIHQLTVITSKHLIEEIQGVYYLAKSLKNISNILIL